VGATVTQHPGRFAAAICSAPLLDMVRYELFGLGETWNDEYGTAADPTVLGTVFDGDTRVDPLHARKMCAAMQHATAAPLGARPVLLRREQNVGHGARAVSRTVALASEQLVFLAGYTGLVL